MRTIWRAVQLAAAVMPVVPDYRIYDLHDRVQERSGGSFDGVYLKKHTGSQKFGACYFGVFYALSGYMAAYSWNIMWLDCIVLLPLILHGLERLVREKRAFYCLMLGLSILSNYYISIMILSLHGDLLCGAPVSGERPGWKDCLHSFFLFGVYSLLAGALAAAVLLPEIAALQSTASGDFNFRPHWKSTSRSLT